MISWYMKDEDNWLLSYKDKHMNLKSFDEVKYCARQFGISNEDIHLALTNMIQHDHNSCQFGVWKSFIYSEKI